MSGSRRRGPLARLRSRLERRSRWEDKSRRERGVVVVWFALMLIVLLGFAGFAVDMSNWWFQAERLQRAADAGAHAGVVFLPADLPGATTTARAEAAKNGYTASGAGANSTIAVSQEPNPNRLRVRITTEVPTYFVGLLGVDSVELTREAVAEYISPVPMGSPENRLGNDPEIGYNPQLWSMVGGPQSYKHWGDRYQAKRCQLSGSYFESNCTSSATIRNDDYATDGYLYALEVKETVAGQPLRIQIYDPAFVDTGSTCSTVAMSTTQTSQLRTWNNTRYGDAPTRYAGSANQFCSGDIDHEGANIDTSYVVRAPDSTEWSDTDNPVINTATCRPQSFKPYNPSSGTDMYNWLRSNATESVVDNVAPWSFAEVFHRWVTVCEIPAASVNVGTYILQIRTNATAAAPTVYNASVATGGHNRFSIRAGFGASGVTSVDGSKLTLSARGRLPLFTNATAANAEFFLARVLPYDAGRTLRISLFDMGDVSGGAGTLQIVPPTEYASTFSGCSFARDGSSAGALVTTPSTCTLSQVSAANGYQGKLVTIDVPIPQNYTCTETAATGCWIKVKANFPGGVNDVTTWSAAILGNPVRLVE
jgi:Flp pilus assembly protein TadG